MSRIGLFAAALFSLIIVLPQSELTREPDAALTVDPDAPLTASDLGWRKMSFRFDLEDDEVAVMQRQVKSDGPYFSAFRVHRGNQSPLCVLLKPAGGGSYSDSIGAGFNVSGKEGEDQGWVTQLSQSGVAATLKAECGSFQCVWRLQKMKLSRATELVPDLQSVASRDSFIYSGDGVILPKD